MYVKTIRGQALGLAKFPPECKQPQGRRGASADGWERILERRERRRRRRSLGIQRLRVNGVIAALG